MNADGDGKLEEILVAYGLEIQTAERAPSGLINQTWIVETPIGERYVAQRLHPVFPSDVNDRIQFVTKCLEEKNICTPRLVMTRDGENHVTMNGAVWRVLTYIAGKSYDVVPDAQHAFEAGLMLARFHGAFIGRDDVDILPRLSTHELRRHLERLRAAIATCSGQDEYASVEPLAREIFAFAESLPRAREDKLRVVHGDPKISNVLFDNEGSALCLVDLDTVGRMALIWELGDAFRSWCNPRGEDTENTAFSLELFAAAMAGYAVETPFMTPSESAGIVPAILTIYTELAARFCDDALRQSYFAWDPTRFPNRTEHNLVRARGQLNAAKDLASKQEEALRIVMQKVVSGS